MIPVRAIAAFYVVVCLTCAVSALNLRLPEMALVFGVLTLPFLGVYFAYRRN